MEYNHLKVEKKWEEYWFNNNIFVLNIETKKKKYYSLDMFPYPSGKGLHVGHPRGYTGSDIVARYKRFNGFEVFHPIGFDSFGLPSEQYSIKTGNHPYEFTMKNIELFKKQLRTLGFSFDYLNQLSTSDPWFFKWTQWMFIKLYEKGLAKKVYINVNWCDELSTVLANEETEIIDNKVVSSIGNFPVTQRKMSQWVIKITKYAQRLLDGLDKINYPSNITKLQKKWIGKTEGQLINVMVKNKEIPFFLNDNQDIKKICGLVISSQHPILTNMIKLKHDIYFEKIKNMQNITRSINSTDGVKLDIRGYLKNIELPIYIATKILDNDQNSALFITNDKKWENFIKQNNISIIKIAKLNEIHKKTKVFFKLQDWVFSRQRFWGEPIPIYYDEKGNENIWTELPLLLPNAKKINIKKSGFKGPLSQLLNWNTFEKNNQTYLRETNVMPQWAGSCWYFIGYLYNACRNKYGKDIELTDPRVKKILNKFMPVDYYVGGQEHAVTHMIYSRFWNIFLSDIGILDHQEPFINFKNQGMILTSNYKKMSKSKGNVINPDSIIKEYGADSLRLYEMFIGPFSSDQAWNNKGISGMRKWLDRVYRLFTTKIITNQVNPDTISAFNICVRGLTDDIEKSKFNTAISRMMIYINVCYKTTKDLSYYEVTNFIKMLNPFCPFISEELWEIVTKQVGINKSVLWPKYNKKEVEKTLFKIPIQINGKLRAIITFTNEPTKEAIIRSALNNSKIKMYIDDKNMYNFIYIKNKILNIVKRKSE